MKVFVALLCFTVCFWSCQPSKVNEWSTISLNEKTQSELKYALARYWEKAPKKARADTKFDAEFDSYYQEKSKQAILSKYYPAANDTIYMEIQKRAPSFEDKWVGIGIKVVKKDDELQYYREVYRTWKFTTPILEEKTAVIFKDWIDHKPLDIYYPENHIDEFIEFPDANNYFDDQAKQWVQRSPSQI